MLKSSFNKKFMEWGCRYIEEFFDSDVEAFVYASNLKIMVLLP